MAERYPDFTPIILLTGFLGSGKTTLLKQILADPAFGDTAVIINEFGEVGLDHHLIEHVADDVVLLPSGCLCCAMKGELAATLRDLQSRRARGAIPAFRRIIVESSGLADPYPVISTIKADPMLRHHFRLETVLTTIDAVNGARTLDRHMESIRQAAVADTLILTKTDLAAAADVASLRARLGDLNPAAAVVLAADAATGLKALVEDGGARSWFKATAEPGVLPPSGGQTPQIHGAEIRSFSLTIDAALDWTMFGIWLTMLINRHGLNILRVKGILSIEGEANPVAVHGVQHLVHPPQHLRGWPDTERRSRLVFIVDGIEPDQVRRSLAAFMALTGETNPFRPDRASIPTTTP
jgi:G3E family GTPase